MEHVLMEVWEIIFLYKWVIYRFHVKLPGCRWAFMYIPLYTPWKPIKVSHEHVCRDIGECVGEESLGRGRGISIYIS